MSNRLKNDFEKLTQIIIALFCGYYFQKYMRIASNSFIWICISCIILYMLTQNYSKFSRREVYLVYIFSGILGVSIVAGYHIKTNFNLYFGLMTESYITDYSVSDVFALGFLIKTISCFFKFLISRLGEYTNKLVLRQAYGIDDIKKWMIFAFCFFVLWIPYFLVFYPGFIFGDSLSSIAQALGQHPLNNHHPIMYTFFVKLCIWFGEKIKNVTFGCAVYTIFQMFYISCCISYMICWLGNKGISLKIQLMLVAMYGVSPFFAQNSIAMWKDPMFSATFILWTLKLCDYILLKGDVVCCDKCFWLKYATILILICFLRNNGIYIVLFSELAFGIVAFLLHHSSIKICKIRKLLVVTGIIWVISSFVTGPVYSRLELQGEPVESLGIVLNQMARVAATGGEMSEKDANLMDSLLPMEKYPETYRPLVVDMLKWDVDFSQSYLNSHLKEFFYSYISMMLKNPKVYLEGWELNTFGYWAINYWEFNFDAANIYKGDLDYINRNENFGVTMCNLLENDYFDVKSYIKAEDSMISLAVINWVIILLAFLAVLKCNYAWGVVLAPSLGTIFVLLIATPYVYWQRYGLMTLYLLPIYMLLFFYVLRNEKG